MTLIDNVFKYVIIKEDQYIIKPGVTDKEKQSLKNYIQNVKCLYRQEIIIEGLNK